MKTITIEDLTGNESGDDLARLYIAGKITLVTYFSASRCIQIKTGQRNS